MSSFPSSNEILEEAIKLHPNADVNKLHSATFTLMKKYRDLYYPSKVDELFKRPFFKKLGNDIKNLIKIELLKPIKIKDKIYTNFMEESARRISQTFQPISGNLAELCVERELKKKKLVKNTHYKRSRGPTDFILFHPSMGDEEKKHRVEVKNVSVRERTTRGLAFDGDSLFGFFNQPSEFTANNIKIINKHCAKTGGYSYVPPQLLSELNRKAKDGRFKSNKEFAKDMARFVKKGSI